MTERPTPPPTVEKLRDDIDSGRTGDKVDYPDPAAVPLGADAEAGGHSPTAQELQQAAAATAPEITTRAGHNRTGIIIFGVIASCIVIATTAALLGS